jgi:hypothetical protein
MIENPSKHTFIVTIDKATVDASKENPEIINDISILLMMNGLTKEDATIIKGKGIYYKKTFLFQ